MGKFRDKPETKTSPEFLDVRRSLDFDIAEQDFPTRLQTRPKLQMNQSLSPISPRCIYFMGEMGLSKLFVETEMFSQTKSLGKEWETISYSNIWVFPKIGVPQNGWFIKRKSY